MAFTHTTTDDFVKVDFNVISARELVDGLIRAGFRFCKPKAKTWHSALLHRNKDEVLCVLLRRNGADIRFYSEYKGEVSIDSSNIASFVGGELYRNSYKDSYRLHRRIQDTASKFVNGKLKKSNIPGKLTSTQSIKEISLSNTLNLPSYVDRDFF